MPLTDHSCDLPRKDTTGLPKIPPNAAWHRRLLRRIRLLLTLDPTNRKCKKFFRTKSMLLTEQRRHAISHSVIIHPFSKLGTFLEMTFLLVWLYRIFVIPLEFEPAKAQFAISIHDYCLLPIQNVLIISFFFLGYVEHKQVITEPKKIIIHYLTTYFVFDLIASDSVYIVLDPIIVNFSESEAGYFRYHIATTIFKIFCYAVRVDTLVEHLNILDYYFQCWRGLRFAISHLVKAYIFIHMVACLLYFIPKLFYFDDWPEESWLVQANIDPNSDRELSFVYSECMLLATCYFLGASHGLYRISQPLEEVCLSATTLFGRLYTLFLLADVLQRFGIADLSESRFEQGLTQLEEYMNAKKLPQQLRRRLLKYYEHKLQKHYFNEREILSTLSQRLRTELFLFTARTLIQKARVFRVLPRPTLGVVIASMKSETFAPRDVIIEIGTTVDNIYFIASGTVAVINKDGRELCHLEDGDEFGVAANVTEHIHLYKHMALETTEVFYINTSLFMDLIQEHPDVIRSFESTVKTRLARYVDIEENTRRGGRGLLLDLHSGHLLEARTRRATLNN